MRLCFCLGIALLLATACEHPDPVVKLAVSTDVHGMIFPYDFINREVTDHSLAHIYSYVRENRQRQDTVLFLLDNGDFLQGQPTVYYFNFIEEHSAHLSARVMNYMGYAAGTVGNHDIEAGPGVYDRLRDELEFPWLAANAVDKTTGKPYFEAYTLLHAGRKRIAVLGMITPGIPHWLPQDLWPGMEFRDMVETAEEWISMILEKERPDLVVGLFHSGTDAAYGGNPEPYLNDNATLLVAEQVPGFDVIFAGHDHQVSIHHVVNVAGDSVLVVDPGSHARYVGEVTVSFAADGRVRVQGRNVSMKGYPPSQDFLEEFEEDRRKVSRYLEDTITWLAGEMNGRDALFGPSAILSLLHRVQLELSGADLSFAAPLSLRATLDTGPVLASDLFKLYRYENMLYTMNLTGEEIDAFLEYTAGIWFNTMEGPDDPMLQFRDGEPGNLAHPYNYFSTAAGIEYTVDLTEPPGDRVTIRAFSNGEPFAPGATYSVAVNSYRGSGGGGHLTRGAGIARDSLPGRITWSSDIDLRYHIMQYLAGQDTLHPDTLDNWHCIPESWARRAASREREYF